MNPFKPTRFRLEKTRQGLPCLDSRCGTLLVANMFANGLFGHDQVESGFNPTRNGKKMCRSLVLKPLTLDGGLFKSDLGLQAFKPLKSDLGFKPLNNNMINTSTCSIFRNYFIYKNIQPGSDTDLNPTLPRFKQYSASQPNPARGCSKSSFGIGDYNPTQGCSKSSFGIW